ncbi:MAG: class I SAM-dependent rRNA methyltransferase [Bacteroides sp.]|jgi:23S rRNA (cytosine1962-C5)-methyltransferase|nr:class I SAM-dependent rRNA methyltransferase [Bacteroides sp.]
MQGKLKIILHPGKDGAIRRFHPWVFSGAIKKIEGEASDGMHADVFSHHGDYLGAGIYQDATIAIRILAFPPDRPERLDEAFWTGKLEKAFHLRKDSGLSVSKETNVYRLVHGEGDHLPGLIIDHYNGHLVIQVHATGMYYYLEAITGALKKIYGTELKSITDKSRETLPDTFWQGKTFYGNLFGETGLVEVMEYGHKFLIDIEKGQKTGFFIDQRENRKILGQYAAGRKVLNTFCYSGGFSVYGLQAGATEMHSLDSSARAIELTERNIALNFGEEPRHRSITQDSLQYLKHTDETYDVIILDPPAYAKHTHARHNALQGYKRLNLEAMRKIKPGGLLFTFSCSQVVDMPLFRGAVLAAAIESGRSIRILHQLNQPADHPVNIFHPEGEYLKGLVLKVE